MKIFITGATGFIGQNLSIRLAEEGHIIHALCRSDLKAQALKHRNIRIFKGDILDVASIEKAMQDCSQVFHLAAYAKIWAKDPLLSEKINVHGTNNVLNACKKYNVEKIVVTSTAAVLGPSLNGDSVNEHTQRDTDFFTEYERTKFKSIEYIKEYCVEGMNIVVVYPTRVYGPGIIGQSNVVTSLIQRFINKRVNYVPGSREMVGNYAYIRDVVQGHILAMDKGNPGSHYILGGENFSYEKLFEILFQLRSKRYMLITIPSELLLITSFFFNALNNIFGIEPIVTREWVKKLSYNWKCSNKKAQMELGYQITPPEIGFKETIDWLIRIYNE